MGKIPLEKVTGVRQDHRVAKRDALAGGAAAGAAHTGCRFFADDEDEFGLEDVLQVAV